MKSLRIVMVLSAAPLPFGSAVGRWFYVMLRGLPARGHRVTAFVPCANRREMDDTRQLFRAPEYSVHCFEYAQLGPLASKLAAFRRPQSYVYSPDLSDALERELAVPYDVLQFESQWCGWLARVHRARTMVNVHDLFRVDCGERPGGVIEGLQFDRMWNAEAELLRSFRWICPLSSEMGDEVRRLNLDATIEIVPFGMELDNYPFETDLAPGEQIVTLIGTFDWLPTRMAAERLLTRLWPAIRARVPGAQLQLVGRNVRSTLAGHQQPGVTIHENVPDIVPYFRNASVLLYAPERGSGMKVKVLESFLLGLPVVTTKAGVEGIPAIDGIHAGVSEDDAGLIERCVALLENRDAQIRQRSNARDLVERHCSAEVALNALEICTGKWVLKDNLRIGINARLLNLPSLRGWNRYTINLLEELAQQGVELVLYTQEPPLAKFTDRLPPDGYRVRVSPPMPYLWWEQYWLPRQCAADGISVFHSPFNFGLPWASPCPRVLTLHDAMLHIRGRTGLIPRRRELETRLYHWIARLRAEHIITVTECAREELTRTLGIRANRITAIHEGADPSFSVRPPDAEAEAVMRRFDLRAPYFFYAGGWEERKNLPFLVNAFGKASLGGVDLVLAGGLPNEMGMFGEVPPDHVRLFGWLDDVDLAALYAGALAFVYPSRHEGFGLQICEAMGLGCPVLAARASSLPEVLGDGGETFSLDGDEELIGLLRRVTNEPSFRADLVRRGNRRSKDLSWRRTAQQTISIYRKVMEHAG